MTPTVFKMTANTTTAIAAGATAQIHLDGADVTALPWAEGVCAGLSILCTDGAGAPVDNNVVRLSIEHRSERWPSASGALASQLTGDGSRLSSLAVPGFVVQRSKAIVAHVTAPTGGTGLGSVTLVYDVVSPHGARARGLVDP